MTWTIATVLDGIRARAVEGLPLAARTVRDSHRGLLEAATRLLPGGWQEALERAAERYPQLAVISEAVDAHRPRTADVDQDTAGGRLRQARRVARMSQSQAAAAAGVTQATWSLYETGGRGMRPPPAAWRAVGRADDGSALEAPPAPPPPAAPRGRPPIPRRRRTPEGGTYVVPARGHGLLGMSPTELARWLHGPAVDQADMRRVHRICAGETDPGVQWLAALLERVGSEVDIRELVADLAERIAAKRR